MSSGEPSTPHPSTLPVVEGSELHKAIQSACNVLKLNFKAEYDDDKIKQNFDIALTKVRYIIKKARNSKLKARLRDDTDFVKPGSNEERNLLGLLRRMAEGQVPWEKLFLNGTLLSSL